MFKKILIIVTFLATFSGIYGQSDVTIKEINLPDYIQSDKISYEFSALARWKDNALLIPAFKNEEKKYRIYSLKEKDLYINIINPSAPIKVDSIEIDAESFRSNVSSITGYDGLEAAVVVGDSTIYFSVEVDGSKGDYCRIVKGKFETDDKGRAFIKITGNLNIPRQVFGEDVKINDNSGFESMAYLPKEKKLIVFFEDRDKWRRHFYYKIDPDLKNLSSFILDDSREDRLSDICLDEQGQIVGISSRFNAVGYARSVIVSIDLTKNKMIEQGVLCLNNCTENWEGIISFAKGVLLVSDNKFGTGPTIGSKLVYCELTR